MSESLTLDQVEMWRTYLLAQPHASEIREVREQIDALCDMALRAEELQNELSVWIQRADKTWHEAHVIEQCAKVCDSIGDDWRKSGEEIKYYGAWYLARQIRALKVPS